MCDKHATHKHPKVKAWLAKNPQVTMHVTPTSGSWLNIIGIFLGIITRQAIRRASFAPLKDVITATEVFIDGWNQRCQPFTWVKTAEEIIGKTNRKRTDATRQQNLKASSRLADALTVIESNGQQGHTRREAGSQSQGTCACRYAWLPVPAPPGAA